MACQTNYQNSHHYQKSDGLRDPIYDVCSCLNVCSLLVLPLLSKMKVNPKQSTLSQSVLLPILNSPQNGACLGRKGRSRRFTTTSLRFPPLILSSLRRCSKVVLQECSPAAESEGEAFKRNSYPNTKGFPFFSYPWEETLPFNVYHLCHMTAVYSLCNFNFGIILSMKIKK